MAEARVSEEELIAWLDGELPPAAADRIARAVAADPALAERAEAHRRLKARLRAAFGPLLDQPVALPRPAAEVHSLDSARAMRRLRAGRSQGWALPMSIAASLVVGVLVGHEMITPPPSGIADRPNALALAAPIAAALDRQASGVAGPVRVALSFRDRAGDYCRSFDARHLEGVACRQGGGWRLRYAAPADNGSGDYRMAGSDPAKAAAIQAMIAGEPLDAQAEKAALATGWKGR